MASVLRTRAPLLVGPYYPNAFVPLYIAQYSALFSSRRSPTLNPHLPRRPFSSSLFAFEKRYTAAHEWIELSADAKTATIGISKYAADALGDVVYVELPTIDLEINSGDAIGAVESVKSASDIYSPVGGTVIEANLKLEEKPSLINQGPEGDGWIARIKLKEGGQEEVQGLMDTSAYREHTDE